MQKQLYTLQLSSILPLTLIMLFALLVGTATLTGCGASEASAKSAKSKKKKKADKIIEDEDSEEETFEEETDKDSAKEKSEKDSHKAKKETKEKPSVSTEKIWADLMEGNKRFVSGKSVPRPLISARQELAKGQHPKVVVLGCADSRVPPELIFDKNLGELFVIRAAGNVADSVMLGSIEYAVEHLHAGVIVVLGHENCGAVAAAVSNEKMPTKNLDAIVQRIRPAFEDSTSCPLGGKSSMECIKLNAINSAGSLLEKSSVIKHEVDEGKLTVIKAVYSLETGEVKRID